MACKKGKCSKYRKMFIAEGAHFVLVLHTQALPHTGMHALAARDPSLRSP